MKNIKSKQILKFCLLGIIALMLLSINVKSMDWGNVLNQVSKAVKTGTKIKKAMDVANLTPLQEHYIGRAVAANILAKYKPYYNQKADRYLNILGQTLAQASDRPNTYMGYRFLILDSDEINSFATPGGFIFITKGMIRCCNSEDSLAAVLAHEIAHVQWKHGLRSIRTKRLVSVGAVLLGEVAVKSGSGDFKNVLKAFNGSVNDISNKLINSKYSRATEVVADQTAVTILTRVGYNPQGFIDLLKTMQEKFRHDRHGFYKTHPAPKSRIRVVKQCLRGYTIKEINNNNARNQRFKANLAGI